MAIYARIGTDGLVAEIISPRKESGKDVPIAARYHPDFVAGLIDITGLSPQPAGGWSYDGKVFQPPADA